MIEYEQALLGVLLRTPSVVAIVELQPEHFSDATHAALFHEIKAAHENDRLVSPVTLKDRFDPVYMAKLIGHSSVIDVAGHVQKILEGAVRRSLVEAAKQVAAGNLSNPDAISVLTDALEAANRSNLSSQMRSAKQVAMNILHDLAEERPVYSTGLPKLDFAMGGGLHQGRLYAFSAQSGHGKTLLASTVANNLKNASTPVLFICAEMGENETHQRSLAKDMKIDSRAFHDASKRRDTFWSDLGYAADTESQSLIYYDDPFLTFDRLRQVICAAVAKYKIKGFILDYWQLVSGNDKSESRADFLGRVAQWQAAACKRYKLFGINTAQLNRDGEVLGSGGLKRAVDQMYTIMRPDETLPFAYAEMDKTRYTKFMHVGSADSPAFKINETGGYFEQI